MATAGGRPRARPRDRFHAEGPDSSSLTAERRSVRRHAQTRHGVGAAALASGHVRARPQRLRSRSAPGCQPCRDSGKRWMGARVGLRTLRTRRLQDDPCLVPAFFAATRGNCAGQSACYRQGRTCELPLRSLLRCASVAVREIVAGCSFSCSQRDSTAADRDTPDREADPP